MNFDIDIHEPIYTISTAARLLGISVHTLRMYEREGLILPHKKDSNHRLYSHLDIERLKCIRTAINEMKYSIESIKTIYSLIPCWSIINCPKEEREVCPAYITHGKPCWTFKHKDNVCEMEKCQDCIVYNDYADCNNIKNGIKRALEN